ncbi:M20/M25/M40 family metallo-hydrolase [Candidatus Halobonum tyrrellensis]|uniref:Succinyl-diaminopimelate desuccinylase n=1 Tax=Candidatus Halobonum tyrrellensis G22 TaxID=1324957 RepID=V4J1T2_9EURY|nr:M20/M25/M40 family metallo-hydrolase [Candidatus Halobonum tyrrellensis]ESP89372.1 succinyl-diaminopimelate desuccinylase [Candidatus Halobonum tyrrellensis G22]
MSGTAGSAAFDPVAFLEEAVRVESHESPGTMRDLLVDSLREHGAEPRVDAAGNVRATRAGDADGPHLVLNTHVDTVPPHVPFERDGGVIRGRGSCDAKGPLAALVAAFLATEPARGRLTLAVTPDEETSSAGADALVRGTGGVDPVEGDAYVVGEPTDCDVCTAARGRFEGTLTLRGSAAHASQPDSGANAVAALEGALAAVRGFDDGRDPHPRLGAPTLVPTRVAGGEASNQVPAEARVTLDRRSVPPETADGFAESLAAAVRGAVPDAVGVSFDLTDRETPFLEAFDTDPEHELVRAVSAAAREAGRGGDGTNDAPDGTNRAHEGTDAGGDSGDGAVRPFGAATEASYFAPAPTVVFGPGHLADDEGGVAHSDREYVRVDRVRTAATAVTDAVGRLLD